jgi:hypothetical protein
MAIYHMTTKNISRSGGGKAIASAAYRSGEKLSDRVSGESYDYTRKRGVIYSEIIAPPGAPEWARSRESLWNEAEAAEKRKDARVAREIEVALPVELTHEEQARLVAKYAAESFVSDGMAADVCIHDRGDGNPHAHIMLTTREITPAGWGSKGKESKNQTSWNRQGTLERWREEWEACANAALEMAGRGERVDRRTLAEQGIGRMPQIHVGAYANAMPGSDRKAANEEIKRLNAGREAAERGIAEFDRRLSELEREIRAAAQEQEAATEASGSRQEHDTARGRGAESSQEAKAKIPERGSGTANGAAAQAQDSQPPRPAIYRAAYGGLEEYRNALAARLEAEAREIARPMIAEAERKWTEAEAIRVKAEKAAIYRSFLAASADRDAHEKKEPPKPPFFQGRGKWKLEHERWEAQLEAKQRRAADLWEKAGGGGSREHEGYGREEADRRLTGGYALEEAEKNRGRSGEWKAMLKNISDAAFQEACRRDPGMKETLDEADRELAELKAERGIDRRIAELDRQLENPAYPPGSAGFSLLADYAQEAIRLERERGADKSEAMRRHPAAAAVLEEHARHKRDRGMGR